MKSVLHHVFIGAGGPCSRWFAGPYTTPKHLLEVDGERLLDRTVRLCRQHGAAHIDVIGPHSYDPRYEVAGAYYIQSLNLGLSTMFEIFGRNLATGCEMSTYLHGDVYFTEECFERIATTPPGEEGYVFFGREGDSPVCPWGEMWGLHWLEHKNRHLHKVVSEMGLFASKLPSFTPGIWNLYNGLAGLTYDNGKMGNAFVEINDETEDFDFAHDYDNWLARHERRNLCTA